MSGEFRTDAVEYNCRADRGCASVESVGRRVVVVMPAYNAAATLERTCRDLPRAIVDEVILVDDGSVDDTVAIARSLGLTVFQHPENRGYGANQKTCYRTALARDADIVAMIHPDYQYDARLLPLLVGFIDLQICDVVLGSRIRCRREALAGGMPPWKYVANRVLTCAANMVLGQNLGDFHSGFRVYTRRVLATIPFETNSDDFVFDAEFLAQAAYFGFRIGDVPVPVRYFPEASSIDFQRSVVYGIGTLSVLARYLIHRARLAPSILFRPKLVR
jgi:glycosyltransferase involved in cell wall biosynthesis